MKTAIHPRGPKRARQIVRKGVESDSRPPVAVRCPVPEDPTLCLGCGAVYSHKVWRWPHGLTDPRLEQAARADCPACEQVRAGTFHGLVHASGGFVDAEEDRVRARIENVARRAAFTQPERRIVSIRRTGPDLEIRTTSEKLAHRITHELLKAFGGEASYRWSGRETALRAVWTCELPNRAKAPVHAKRKAD